MSKNKWNDELSAFLDGEARDPERIRKLLQEDPELAARHQQWSTLSQHLRTLPEPEVRPEFMTRVMAHVREQESVAARPAWLPFALPLLSLAMLALVIGGIVLRENTTTTPDAAPTVVAEGPSETTAPEVVDPAAAPESVVALDLTDDEAVVAQLAMLFEAGAVPADTAGGYYSEGETEGELPTEYDAAWTILDDSSWENAYLDVFGDESDWYSELDDIPADQWDAFDELLNDYISEDLS